MQGVLSEENVKREIGGFILHEQFNQQEDEEDDPKAQFKDLTTIQQTYVMDHDFTCIANQRDPDYESNFQQAIESYVRGEWGIASNIF